MSFSKSWEECRSHVVRAMKMGFHYQPVGVTQAELDATTLKSTDWLHAILSNDDTELTFWKLISSIRCDDLLVAMCQVVLFRDFVGHLLEVFGLDETQRRFARSMTLLTRESFWNRFDDHKIACQQCCWIRSTLADDSAIDTIERAIERWEPSIRIVQGLAMLGTDRALDSLVNVAHRNPRSFIGYLAERNLAFLGRSCVPQSLHLQKCEHAIELDISMALATHGDSRAMSDLADVVNLLSEEWIQGEFKKDHILTSLTSQIGDIREWLRQGIQQGVLVFPKRAPILADS